MKTVFLVTLFFVAISLGFAQMPDGKIILPAKVVGLDTIPVVSLRVVEVSAFVGKAKSVAYYKLKNNVRVALPYARKAAATLAEINDKSLTFKNNRERKRYLKEQEEILKAQFEDKLKDLTVTQGQILIKLIDRETGASTYALVKDLKGGINAVFWQTIAHFWGSNLKVKYDPKGEDAMMEQVVQELDYESSRR